MIYSLKTGIIKIKSLKRENVFKEEQRISDFLENRASIDLKNLCKQKEKGH